MMNPNLTQDDEADARQHDRRWPGPRDDAESPKDRPLLSWPSERDRAPRRCHRCGSATLETDPPGGFDPSLAAHWAEPHGETRCLLCSRVVVRWVGDRPPRRPLTHDELHPSRGRRSTGVTS